MPGSGAVQTEPTDRGPAKGALAKGARTPHSGGPPGPAPMPPLSRRTFLRASAVAGAAVTFGPLLGRPARGAVPGAPPPAPPWTDRPMRWGQLTLDENDPGNFDPQFWLDYFRQAHCDAVCLSAGGCVAFYPTEVPFHHRSAWLGARDVFGDLVKGCRELGLVVLARTDPHATYDDVAAAHPDWIAVEADGRPRRHWASPDLWVTCGLGPYNFDFLTEVHGEILRRYPVDGIFVNRWEGSGTCYCPHCTANFRTASGLAIPRGTDPRDPAYRAFLLWRQERLFELWRRWDDSARAINPATCVIPNTGGGAGSSLDMRRIGEIAPTLMADRQSRHGLAAPWANGKNAKEYRAAMGSKPVVGIFSVAISDDHRWTDSVQGADEIRLWVADGLANGMRPWFTKFGGTVNDPRWLKPVADLYAWCQGAERYLRNERPLARVAIVYSQQTSWFAPGANDPARSIEDAALGWYQALIEARVPFEMVHDRLLDAGHVAAFQTLILPNLVALSDAQCGQLRAFVAGGGSLIATAETSLRDEWGEPRPDFGLGDLLGVRWAGRTEGPMKNAYLRLAHDAPQAGALLAGLEDAPRIIHGVWRVEVAARDAGYRSPLTLIPASPDLPMERTFSRPAATTIPQAFLREAEGGGRVVYFPWDLDRTYWEVLALDHGRLLRNAVAWATREEPPAVVRGAGVIDVTLWQQRDSVTVHLVNLTNPMMMKGPVRELFPVGEQSVRVRLPAGRTARRVRLLVAGGDRPFRQTGAWLETAVPAVAAHEVVAIDT
jgi:hypothetical protein